MWSIFLNRKNCNFTDITRKMKNFKSSDLSLASDLFPSLEKFTCNIPLILTFLVSVVYPWLLIFRASNFLLTAMKFRLHTIANIWSKVGVLWGGLMYPKHPAKHLTGCLHKVRHQSFPMRHYITLYLKGLQNCRSSKSTPAGYRTRASRRPSMKDGFSARFFSFFLTGKFDDLQFCSPSRYKDL